MAETIDQQRQALVAIAAKIRQESRAVLDEPLPEDMLALIAKLNGKPKPKPSSGQ